MKQFVRMNWDKAAS